MTEAQDVAALAPERGPRSGFAGRARIPPVVYPAGILAAFVLIFLVRTGVSPYAAGRPLLVALGAGLGVTWLLGLVVGDRDRAGILAIAVVVILLAGQVPVAAVLSVGVIGLVLLEGRMSSKRPRRIRWNAITRVMNAVTAVLLVAIGIAAVQDGRMVQIAHDFVAEARLGHGTPSANAGTSTLPSVYLVLLDGYPRADKLIAEFGIDNAPFVRSLRERAFAVADHGRSNHVDTLSTLASMFNGRVPDDPAAPTDAEFRPLINEGAILQEYSDRGYEVIAFSSGFEGVALRQADRFVDSGQLNEFEWHLLLLTGLAPILDWTAPTLLADHHRARILATLDGTRSVAREPHDRPRVVLAHILSPHSPLILGPDGDRMGTEGMWIPFDDRQEYESLGPDEYSRRLADQIGYLNQRVLELVDSLAEADPGAVVVVFSDHGSGIRDEKEDAAAWGSSDTDLRTANLLAVRSPGSTGIIDDRSTLVNLLPRILRAHTGRGPADVPETIYGRADGRPFVFARPD